MPYNQSIVLSRVVFHQGVVRMFSSEKFKESLKGQFKESVQMAIQECYSDYQNTLDIELLHEKLSSLQRFALRDGFKPHEWSDLISNLCPESYTEYTGLEIAA